MSRRYAYEFDVKVGIVSTNKESFVIGAKTLPGNPYDGHTLQACIKQAERVSGIKPQRLTRTEATGAMAATLAH